MLISQLIALHRCLVRTQGTRRHNPEEVHTTLTCFLCEGGSDSSRVGVSIIAFFAQDSLTDAELIHAVFPSGSHNLSVKSIVQYVI